MGHLPDLNSVEGIIAVLSLTNVAEFGNVLHPDTYASGVKPDERMRLIHVRKLARNLVDWLICRYEFRDATGEQTGEKHLATQYLYHHAFGLLSAKSSSDSMKIKSSVPGLTLSSLRRELGGCLGKSWEQLPYTAVKSFTWEDSSLQVSKRAEPLRASIGK
jgi:hypothetical protein